MKKRLLLIVICILLLITIMVFRKGKDNKYFVKDEIMFAVVVDGDDKNAFPSRGKYHVDIECENGDGRWLSKEWKMAIQNITGKVSCNVMFTSISNTDYNKNIGTQIENSVGTSGNGSIVNENTAGFRYEGKNPNNYIWFNDEMWRIIGNVPVCLTSGCGNSSTKLVKIIRNKPIGNISYDAKSEIGTGEWGSNTLYKLLNEYYYGNKNATGNEYCYGYSNTAAAFCDYSSLGLSSSDYYGNMIENVYWNTGTSTHTQTASQIYNSEKSKQDVRGRIGLMSASDYGFATNYGRNNLASYNNVNYTGTNWLYGNGNEMTSTQFGNEEYLRVNTSGSIINDSAIIGYVFRPVVYLSEGVFIVSGDGTEANPYQISK